MNNILKEIIQTKEKEVAALLHKEELLKAAALQRDDFRGFRAALDRGPDKLAVIAEIKKASPSAGIIDPGFDPVKQFQMYAEGNATCISILTDEKYFQGSLSYLAQISAIDKNIPLLRKDFIIHPVQIYEAVVSGADAILLIVACLNDQQLNELYGIAKNLQLDVLVEVHNMEELERALDLGADIIGINNRDLKTFKTDLSVTEDLIEEIPDNIVVVGESGIRNTGDAQRLLDCGCNAILVGETLMKADIPQEQLMEFLELTAEYPEDDDDEEEENETDEDDDDEDENDDDFDKNDK